MLHTPESDLSSNLEAEIAKAKKRLDIVYIDVENLKKDKYSLEDDIARIEKHVSYLNQTIVDKQAEIDRKQKDITSLDSQIADRQMHLNVLQKNESDLNQSLSDKKDERDSLLEEINVQKEALAEDKRSTAEHLQNAHYKHVTAEEKLKKIGEFLKSIT